MKIVFNINTENAAFDDWGLIEVQRIVEEAAAKIVDIPEGTDSYTVKLYDQNGNPVGGMEVSP